MNSIQINTIRLIIQKLIKLVNHPEDLETLKFNILTEFHKIYTVRVDGVKLSQQLEIIENNKFSELFNIIQEYLNTTDNLEDFKFDFYDTISIIFDE